MPYGRHRTRDTGYYKHLYCTISGAAMCGLITGLTARWQQARSSANNQSGPRCYSCNNTVTEYHRARIVSRYESTIHPPVHLDEPVPAVWTLPCSPSLIVCVCVCVCMAGLYHSTIACTHLGCRTVTMVAPLLLTSGPVMCEAVLHSCGTSPVGRGLVPTCDSVHSR